MSLGFNGGTPGEAYINLDGVPKLKIDAAGNLTLLAAGARVIAPNTLVQSAYSEYTSAAGYTNSIIPFDNTIPQITEGTLIHTLTFTPKSAANRMRVRFNGNVNSDTVANIQAAIFVGAGADAKRARSITMRHTTDQYEISMDWEGLTGTTAPLTVQVRMGMNTNGVFALNTIVGVTPIFGGASASTLIVEEFTPA